MEGITMTWITRGNSFHLSDLDGRLPDGTYAKLDRDQLLPVQWADGFQVACTDWNSPASSHGTNNPATVNTLVRDLPAEPGVYVGVWTDDAGITWVEPSYWVEHEHAARSLAKYWHQIEIFNWSTDESVKV